MNEKNNKYNNRKYENKLIRYIVFMSIALLVVFISPYLLTRQSDYFPDFTSTGQIGDTIGGILGPFVAIIASILTFIAFWEQYKANQQARSDLMKERFENNLFQLITVQEEITNNLYYTPKDGADHSYGEKFRGRQIFEEIYENKFCGYGEYGLKMKIEVAGLMAYEQEDEICLFDHYFRHLYRIIKYVNDQDFLSAKEKYEYVSMVRSNLSRYELIMLFYNCLSSNGRDKFKNLIEEYAFLNNIRVDMLATENDRELYALKLDKEFVDSEKDFSTEYRKGAFVYQG